ncbi:helix-turn-helix domain-containing protein [Paenibacillus xylanivorans]|uniref:Transcriptional regulator n=1 Tax=Paenibacillus xylanivorans TaxID=1705561 RepID=A0A0M9BM75_9BACL|nr:helix-turn-helix transcriptional regulator [Paenibacillus xylanivorans]KOY14296.1 transcriptional regulator [Paenibacillus xylanivorans]
MKTLRNSVGERIRAIRKAKGLTQQQLAELSGLDDAYIGSVERGERNFSIDTLEKIILGLNIPIHQIFVVSRHENNEDYEINKAVDEYSILLTDLNLEQIKALNNIVHEVKKVILS